MSVSYTVYGYKHQVISRREAASCFSSFYPKGSNCKATWPKGSAYAIGKRRGSMGYGPDLSNENIELYFKILRESSLGVYLESDCTVDNVYYKLRRQESYHKLMIRGTLIRDMDEHSERIHGLIKAYNKGYRGDECILMGYYFGKNYNGHGFWPGEYASMHGILKTFKDRIQRPHKYVPNNYRTSKALCFGTSSIDRGYSKCANEAAILNYFKGEKYERT